MKNELYLVKNKIPELCYAITVNGIESAKLDITHPYFISSIDETKLKELLSKVEKTADKNAEKFNKIPGFMGINNTPTAFTTRTFINTTPLSVLEVESDPDISIYPNPSPGWIRIDSPDGQLKGTALVNLTGGRLFNTDLNSGHLKPDMGHYPSGTYILRIFDQNDHVAHAKLLIQ